MSVSLNFRYTDPTTGDEANATATYDLVRMRLDTEVPEIPGEEIVLSCTCGTQKVYRRLVEPLASLLYGRPSRSKPGVNAIEMSAPYTANTNPVPVTLDEYVNLGSPVAGAVMILSTTGTLVETLYSVGLLETVTLHEESHYDLEIISMDPNGAHAEGFCLDANENAYLCAITAEYLSDTLSPSSLNISNAIGVKTVKEQPTTPTITAVDGGSNNIYVTITEVDQEQAKYYDVYVRSVDVDLPGNALPDLADIAVASFTDSEYSNYATTYDGGAHGGGGSIGAATYYVTCVAKDSPGNYQVIESNPCDYEVVTVA